MIRARTKSGRGLRDSRRRWRFLDDFTRYLDKRAFLRDSLYSIPRRRRDDYWVLSGDSTSNAKIARTSSVYREHMPAVFLTCRIVHEVSTLRNSRRRQIIDAGDAYIIRLYYVVLCSSSLSPLPPPSSLSPAGLKLCLRKPII